MNGIDRSTEAGGARGRLGRVMRHCLQRRATRYRLIRSGHPALMPVEAGRLRERRRFVIDVEFKRAEHSDHGGRAISIFGSRKFECLGSIDEKAAANSVLILNHPVSPTVLADHEKQGLPAQGTLRIAFVVLHDPSPSKIDEVNRRSQFNLGNRRIAAAAR
jgi:hypothetical protein